VCKNITEDKIIESETKMVEEMKNTQKSHQKKVIKMVFQSMPTFLKDILASIQQKTSSSRASQTDLNKTALSYLPDIFNSLYKLIDKFVTGNL
jgi:hypothetical protein